MGASRKLQSEIDRVLKKVQEGLEVLDSLWIKEKYTDLRKEIKKLRRHRDQIKTWLQSNEIKDEKALMDARNRIEKEMERFKICEKETKTKTFSTEGLEQQPKMDPQEKAKSETRAWLNNTVSELKSQIESFEADMELIPVKKGKTRPPRLTHLESSITRHNAHIMKLELILRLLDNDELTPEQVNDVKDFLDNYVERNLEHFDDFDDVDMLYNTLPLDKGVGAIGAAPSIKSPSRRSKAQKDRVIISPPVVKGVSAAPSMKSPFSRSKAQEDQITVRPSAVVKGVGATGAAPSIISPWSMSKAQLLTSATATSSFQHHDSVQEQADGMDRTPPPKNSATSSAPLTSAITQASPVAVGPSSVLSSPSSSKVVLDDLTSSVPSSPINIAAKEEDISNFPDRKPSSFIPEEGLRDLGVTNLPSITIPTTSGGTVSLGVASGTPRRAILGGDDRLGSSSIVQPLISPLRSRMTLLPSAKTSDVFSGSSSGGNGEVGGIAGRVFPPSGAPGIQWRPGQPFQSQQVRGRTEIETREEFLQRFHQQVQQKGQGTNPKITSLSGEIHKHFTAQQDPLLQLFNSQSSAASPQGMLVGGPAAGLIATTLAQQQPSSIHSLSGQHTLMASGSKDTEPGHVKAEEPQRRQSLSDESATSSVLDKNTANMNNSKVSYTSDVQAGVSGSVTDPVHVTRDIDLSHDQKLQLLESSFHKLPQPEDCEHAKSYNPRHSAKTPQNYPQEQAPTLSNPDFWERLGSDSAGLDNLFFAFYYAQKTDHQYLAARELKKQSWRYHKRWNRWFYLPEEKPVIGDGFEQGTYVYFDHQLGDDDDGWCQRTSDFRFHYQDFEDELVLIVPRDSCNNSGH